ncbi:MAG: electron transport complex subunit RsxC [Elusimicrobia bacterium]|nr:electron transport complex subunit RsxC [Elusimicrobiota bacterium]
MKSFKKTFCGGVHPAQHKDTSLFAIERLPAPERVYLHLSNSAGAPSKPVVKKGDRVLKGSLIAEPAGKISAFIHSSVSGIVEDIKKWPHCSGQKIDAIIIENDFKDERAAAPGLKDPSQLAPSEIVETVRNAGIVGLGGAAFPTDVKLVPGQGKKVTTLIINACECEPYLTSDESLIKEKAADIIEGAKTAARALSAKKIIIGIEDNKSAAAEELLRRSSERINVVALKTKYPQGGEKQLIFALCGKKVPVGGLPADVGVAVMNVQTAFAVYEAVFKGKPLYERVVTLGGYFRKPGNVIIPAGTRLEDIINLRGGLADDVDKIILGGPMMGQAVCDTDVPVSKSASGILLLRERARKEYECLRCLRCASVCPMDLMPRESYAAYKSGGVYEKAANCMECGACAYVCPSAIPLIQYLKLSKQNLRMSNVKT